MKKLITISILALTLNGFAKADSQASSQLVTAEPLPISDPAVRADYENAQRRLQGLPPLPVQLAEAGSAGTRGGGGIAASKTKTLSEWMKSGQFNTVVASYALKIDPSKVTDPRVKDVIPVWNLMMANGLLLDDIKNSKYVPSASCLTGSDPDTAASTVIDGRALKETDVCFDLNKIVSDRSDTASLVTLALHEHTHHFGFGETSAYLITEMVGAQIASMESANSQPIGDLVNSKPGDHRLAASIKKGSKFKLLQNLDRVESPAFQNGRVFSSFADVTTGVFCWLQGYLKPGQSYKLLFAETGFSDVRTSSVSSPDVAFHLDPGSAILTCERRPDQGAQITAQEIHDALDDVFDLDLRF